MSTRSQRTGWRASGNRRHIRLRDITSVDEPKSKDGYVECVTVACLTTSASSASAGTNVICNSPRGGLSTARKLQAFYARASASAARSWLFNQLLASRAQDSS